MMLVWQILLVLACRLPLGTPYYQTGDAAGRMQREKYDKYNTNVRWYSPVTRSVKFVPIIYEVTGSMGPNAKEQFGKWCEEASEQVSKQGGRNYRALGAAHTWNALKFSNLYSQMISFSIVRDTAMTVAQAVERLAVAANTEY